MVQNKKIQSSTEYLLTYGWAFLIAAVVIASLYLFVFAPSTISPATCSFSSGPYCQGMILGSSNSLSKIAILLTNTQPFPIYNPVLLVNISGFNPVSNACRPSLILPGGAIICNATITPAVPAGSLQSGRFILTYTPCPGGNVTLCQSNQRQNFPGTFTAHTSALLSPTTMTITLTAQNSSQVALSTSFDKLTANVRLLGYPLASATVNFTSSDPTNAIISPLITTTDGSGNAYTYISSGQSETVTVTAGFANSVANTVITFTPPVCYTLSASGISGATSNVLTLDGTGYSSIPQQLCVGQGTSHSYAFQSPVLGSAGVQYIFSSLSGCGQTSQSGTLSISSNCTINANYITQYYLTTLASPGAGGTPTPSSQYYNSGTQVTLGETPNGGYFFLSWTGSGTGSFSGNSASPTIGMNGVITEQANFYSTSTTTTTSTTTSSTTSTSTSTSTSTTSTTSTSTSTSTTTVPANPSCGDYIGDAVYSSPVTLSCSVTATNAIFINSGITVNENFYSMEANVLFQNKGTIVSTGGGSGASGGSGGSCGPFGQSCNGSPGSAGGAGSSKTSKFLSVGLSGGAGGGGGGQGGYGAGSQCSNYVGGTGGTGGAGGAGGGVIEIYGGNFLNQGVLSVPGTGASSGGNGGTLGSCGAGGGGGGGGGTGGSGGTIFIGYTTSLTIGTTNVGAGSSGGVGSGGAGNGAGAGAGASGSGHTGGAGGCCVTSNPGSGGAGGAGGGASGTVTTRSWTP